MTGAVFIDFRKAFDSVNHSLLLKKLYAQGIVDQEYEWFTDYLTQVFEFQEAFSDADSICVGVPQGSILRPLLFVLYVNDSPTVARKCSMLMYADETVLFYSGKAACSWIQVFRSCIWWTYFLEFSCYVCIIPSW